MRLTIISFGYLHNSVTRPQPAAHWSADLREHFRDPHIRPELRHMTARDVEVVDAVLTTPGIAELLDSAVAAVRAFASGPAGDRPMTVAVGCAGGRHRAAVFAQELASLVRPEGYDVEVLHRDLDLPVVERTDGQSAQDAARDQLAVAFAEALDRALSDGYMGLDADEMAGQLADIAAALQHRDVPRPAVERDVTGQTTLTVGGITVRGAVSVGLVAGRIERLTIRKNRP